MATVFNPVITSAGLAAAIAANNAGLQLQITHVALGTGAYNPTGSETALLGRKEKATIAGASGGGTAQFTVVATFPSGYGGADYNVGEVGFYAGDPDAGGVLFAVASRSGLIYTTRGNATGTYSAEYAVTLTGVPSGSVNITIDPMAAIAGGLLTNYVRKIGDTMTGPLVLPGNASTSLQAVPLQQVLSLLGGGAQSLTPNGYTTLPGGLILQWFSDTFADVPAGQSGITGTTTFPLAFPNACFIVMPITTTTSAAGLSNWNVSILGTPTLNDVTWKVEEWSGGVNPGGINFLAIGH